MLRGDGQNAILDIQLNVLFVEARQLCLQHVLAVRVADVGAEVRQIYIAVAEEVLFKIIKCVKPVVVVVIKRYHAKHNLSSFLSIHVCVCMGK